MVWMGTNMPRLANTWEVGTSESEDSRDCPIYMTLEACETCKPKHLNRYPPDIDPLEHLIVWYPRVSPRFV